eukprot:1835849-Amphidinium_carterae.1
MHRPAQSSSPLSTQKYPMHRCFNCDQDESSEQSPPLRRDLHGTLEAGVDERKKGRIKCTGRCAEIGTLYSSVKIERCAGICTVAMKQASKE